jgi:hypothetical protein
VTDFGEVWRIILKTDLREIDCEVWDSTELLQDRAFKGTVIDVQFPLRAGKFTNIYVGINI